MRKQQIILLCFIFSFMTIFGQEPENEIEKKSIEALKDWFENPTFDTTSILDLSIMSELKDSGRLENGLREGNWIIYNIDSSQIGKMIDINVNEKKHKMRFDPFIEKYIGNYQKGKKEGTWIKYESLNYKKPLWWIKKSETDYKKGLKHGKEIYFQGAGIDDLDTLVVMFYENGNETGESRIYNLNFPYKLKEVYSLTNDSQTYLSKKFYDDGKLNIIYTDTIINNKFYFYFTEYYENGILKSTGFFNKNNIDSTYREFHTNGKLFIEKEYRDGKLWNVNSIKNLKGKNKKIGDFKDGNGLLNVYDEKGKKITTTEYIDGIEQKK